MGAPVTMNANQKVSGTASATAAGVPLTSGLSYSFSEDSGGSAVVLQSTDNTVVATGNPTLGSEVTVTVTVTVTNPDGSTVSDSSVITVNPVAPPPPANADAVSLDFGTPEDQ